MKNRFIKLVFSISIFFFNFNVNSQNLVPNPSFEIYDTCPANGGEIYFAIPWSGLRLNSSDYFNSCNNAFLDVPSNFTYAYQNPKSGVAYSGLFSYNNAGLEYIQTKLLDTLEVDVCYFVNFFVSKTEDVKYGSNNLGIHFSSTAINTSLADDVLHVPYHILKFNNPVIMDTMNWIEISGIFKSNGDEQYLTVGNFKQLSETDTIGMFSAFNFVGAYYYIDDVSVIAVSDLPNQMPAFAGNDTIVAPGDSIFIGQEISNLNCTWRKLDGTLIADSISGIYVQPTETTTYVVEQNLCGTITYDTVMVYVNPLGVKPLASSASANGIVIYPNPNNGTFEIQNPNKKDLTLELKNALGQVVYTEKIEHEKHFINLSLSKGDALSLPKGIYFATFSNEKVRFEEKIVIK